MPALVVALELVLVLLVLVVQVGVHWGRCPPPLLFPLGEGGV